MTQPTIEPAKLRLIKIDEVGNPDFYFEGSQEPFTVIEFTEGTFTRKRLDEIQYAIQDYNSEVDLYYDN